MDQCGRTVHQDGLITLDDKWFERQLANAEVRRLKWVKEKKRMAEASKNEQKLNEQAKNNGSNVVKRIVSQIDAGQEMSNVDRPFVSSSGEERGADTHIWMR